jgi:uncharacterized protein (DUF2141 family)
MKNLIPLLMVSFSFYACGIDDLKSAPVTGQSAQSTPGGQTPATTDTDKTNKSPAEPSFTSGASQDKPKQDPATPPAASPAPADDRPQVRSVTASGEPPQEPAAAPTDEPPFYVMVKGLKNNTGKICLSLFDKAEGFPDKKEAAIYAKCEVLANWKGKIALNNLVPGKAYAIAIFHDENSNELLDTKKIFGLDAPMEGFGFSKNPGLTIGAPDFEKISFKKGEFPAGMTLSLLYI